MKLLRILAVVIVLAVSFGLQAYYLSSYTQPILFGDPGAYYVVGQKLQQAVAQLSSGEQLDAVFESVRGLLYFLGVGTVYGLIDSLSPQNIPFFRLVLSGFNTLASLGCFFLAYRLSSSYWGGLSSLIFASIYPPFSVQTGRLFPDPITGCLFVWSAYFFLRGVQDTRKPFMFTAGLSLTAALFIRTQLFNYILALLLLTLAVTVFWWWREHKLLVATFVLGCLPFTLLWVGIVHAVGDNLEEIEALGNFTFKQRYPYGFWQFLDSDGWMGPYRLGQEPYYKALEAKAADDPELLESYPRQLVFTAGYVSSRSSESALMCLDNVYRLYDRPANDYKWDYPFPYSIQVIYQRILLIAAIACFVVVTSKRQSYAFVFFVPICLALLHGLSYPWPRFNQPAMPILIAAAGALCCWATSHAPRRWRLLLLVATCAAVLSASGALLRLSAPELARALRALGSIGWLSLPFIYIALPGDDRRRAILAGIGFLVVATLMSAHDIRSPAWHETSIRLGEARQEIALSAEALNKLRSATEAFVVFDLLVPDGNPRGIRITMNGRDISSGLVPTMPRFGESTAAGGRDRRMYRQWWAVPLTPEIIPERTPATLDIVVAAPNRTDITLYGDRFADQDRIYEGPSFGNWPHLAQVKLEYDGDYRLPVRVPISSVSTESNSRSRHRIRVITLGSNEGRLIWETEPATAGERTALAFYAYSGRRGNASLAVDNDIVATFPLGSMDNFDINGLCYRADPPRGDMAYGGYVVFVEPDQDGPVQLTVRFMSGMSIEPMFMSLDRRRSDILELVTRCTEDDVPARGFGAIIEAQTNSYPADTGRWSVANVF
jgi:4-amino-4-deoxy-L-arabinose transferase-like glycosyltransferase